MTTWEKHETALRELYENNAGNLTVDMVMGYLYEQGLLASQLEPQVGKLLLSEIRKHYLVEIDIETGEPKADMKTLMELWDKVNKYLEIKTVG